MPPTANTQLLENMPTVSHARLTNTQKRADQQLPGQPSNTLLASDLGATHGRHAKHAPCSTYLRASTEQNYTRKPDMKQATLLGHGTNPEHNFSPVGHTSKHPASLRCSRMVECSGSDTCFRDNSHI